jgi:threonine aldolase
MYSFRNDYSEGVHPAVLKALTDTNLEQTCGYGMDPRCAEAKSLIRRQCSAPGADVHFVVGGTQANLLVIHALLRSFESVVAADTGHVNIHETGAIEATGHKVCPVASPDGKLTPALVRAVLDQHDGSEHMVHPKLVYISDTTEVGTVYTKAELSALYDFCRKQDLYLFLDGARLGSALTAEGSDLTLPELAALTDVFTIGGTKNGALFGEAIVLSAGCGRADFRAYMKQRGAMLAKGRLLGLQFSALLEDGLYFDIARHANEMAQLLRRGIAELGYHFASDSPSNQIFPIFPDAVVEKLERCCEFERSGPAGDGFTCIRLVTSWATPRSAAEQFLKDLAAV